MIRKMDAGEIGKLGFDRTKETSFSVSGGKQSAGDRVRVGRGKSSAWFHFLKRMTSKLLGNSL